MQEDRLAIGTLLVAGLKAGFLNKSDTTKDRPNESHPEQLSLYPNQYDVNIEEEHTELSLKKITAMCILMRTMMTDRLDTRDEILVGVDEEYDFCTGTKWTYILRAAIPVKWVAKVDFVIIRRHWCHAFCSVAW